MINILLKNSLSLFFSSANWYNDENWPRVSGVLPDLEMIKKPVDSKSVSINDFLKNIGLSS